MLDGLLSAFKSLESSHPALVKYGVIGLLSAVSVYVRYCLNRTPPRQITDTRSEEQEQEGLEEKESGLGAESESKSIMQPARADLEPPQDTPYTQEQLKAFDGSDPSKPIYVAIKGTIFDVTRKAEVYGHGKSYNVFAGKDGSKGLGMSSLKPDHAVSDYSTLDEKDRKVLEDWYKFFSDRYHIVGKVSDLPAPASPSNL